METAVSALTATYGTAYTYGSTGATLCKNFVSVSRFSKIKLQHVYSLIDWWLANRYRFGCHYRLLLRKPRSHPFLHNRAPWYWPIRFLVTGRPNRTNCHRNLERNQGYGQRYLNTTCTNFRIPVWIPFPAKSNTWEINELHKKNPLSIYHNLEFRTELTLSERFKNVII